MAIIRDQQARKEANRQSLMQKYNLGAGLDPKTKELADRLYKPVRQSMQSRARSGLTAKQRQERAYQANVDFINKYSIPETMFAEAAAAGVDQRTIESLRKQSDKARAEALKIRSMSGAPGFVGAMYSSRLRNIGETVGSVASQLQKQVTTETDVQPILQEVRRLRESAAKQEASLLRRQTGRRALLSSTAGGAGFFGGYFKG